MDDKGTLVTIALVGADPTKATIKNAKGEVMNLKLVIHTFYKAPQPQTSAGLNEIRIFGPTRPWSRCTPT